MNSEGSLPSFLGENLFESKKMDSRTVKNANFQDSESEGVSLKFTPSTKKEILRKCAACGKVKNRVDMIKITHSGADNKIIINPDNKTFGRSAYLCYNVECINNVFKKKRLQKALKTNVDEALAEKLKKLLG